MRFTTKIRLISLVIALLPLIVATLIVTFLARTELFSQAEAKLTAVREIKQRQIAAMFGDFAAGLQTISAVVQADLKPAQPLALHDSLEGASSVLRGYPKDQLARMRSQASRIGSASLNRAASVVADGLTQMRGATPPRLILELVAGKITIPMGDNTDLGLLSRMERLERQSGFDVAPSAPAVKQEKPAPKAEVKAEAAKAEPKKAEARAEKPAGNADIAALRRMWPDVIENVKRRRRLTWSLLSASAQIISVDDKHITLGIVNAGARDSFIRSESEPIVSDAFLEVTGVKRKIEVIVDSSVSPNSVAAKTTRVDEDPDDETQLSGTELLMKELGAQVIAESEK